GSSFPFIMNRAVLGVIGVQRYCIDPGEHLARTIQLHGQDLYQGYAIHAASMVRNFGRVWGYVMQTDDVIAWLTTGEAPKRTRLPA
ncbi:MAG: hypothetical protein DMG06_27150, partial [Acidobacteria bacterium]